MPGQVEQLEPVPSIQAQDFLGYYHFKDPTTLPFNALTFPSINCLIPNKDKIVPRPGKTILGQRFSKENTEIGFSNFSQKEEQVGDITKFAPTEFDADPSTAYNSSVQVDSTHYLNFWGSGSKAYAQVFKVDLTTGVITALGNPTQFEADFKGYNSCGQVDASHFINFWTGASFHGYAQIFEVDLTTFDVTLRSTPLTFFAGGTFFNSCVKVDASHYLNFWEDADTIDGKAQTVSINLSTWAITTVGSPLVFEASIVQFNSCGQVDTNHFINFYEGAAGGRSIVVTVNLSTFAVTTLIAAITFAAGASANSFNSSIKVDATHFLNFWRGATGEGRSQVFTINIAGVSITPVGTPFEFYAGNDVKYISPVAIGDGVRFLVFWNNSNSVYAQVFAINTSTGAFEPLGNVLTVASNITGNFNSAVSAGDGINFINFWTEFHFPPSENLGEVALFKVNLSINSLQLEHITSGDHRILFVSVLTRNTGGGDQVTSVTYDGIPMTLSNKVALDSQRERYLYYLVNPNPGIHGEANGVVVTTNTIDRSLIAAATSYFGVLQSAPTIMSSVGPNAGISSISISETPVIDKSWIISLFSGGADYTGGLTQGAGTAFRGGSNNFQMADSGAPISPAAITTLSANFASSTTAVALAIAIAPIGGVPKDKNWPIIGHKKRFTNDGGYVFEVRVVRTNDPGMGDQIEILFPNPLTGIKEWYAITEKANPLEAGTASRYYMDSFLDTNLTASLSRKNSRLIWVNGTKTIFSWSGGVNPITAVVPGVSITGASGKSWISQGFPYFLNLSGFTEVKYIVVKGIKYLVTGGWDTDTLLISDTAGIEVGDVATAWIAPPDSDIFMQDTVVLADTFPNIDFCRQNKNYMFYGSFSSKQVFMSNNFNRQAIESITNTSSSNLDDLALPPTPDYSGSTITIFTLTIDSNGTPDTFKWSYTNNGVTVFGGSGVPIIAGVKQTISSPVGNIGFIFGNGTGHIIGDSWKITASPSIGNANFLGDSSNPPAWANFFYNLPRVPGQGYIYNLDSNFWTMEKQEEDMYTCDQYGNWGYINTVIGSDLQTETISFTPLKQISSSKPIYPYMVGHMENYIVFVTENKTLDFIGRQQFLELPQMNYLSQNVQFDFDAASFTLGSIEYLNKILYITSPMETVMLVYDNRAENKYWQPPQVYSENGILSIVENTLISHSYLRDQTFNLFTGDKGDDGAEYTVRARTALSAGFKLVGRKRVSARWYSKYSSNSFLEGYIEGNPKLIMSAFVAPNDQVGFSHIVKPVTSNNPTDTASIAEAVLGAHPLGNDPSFEGQYFNEIYRDFKPILQYYFIALQIACVAKTHSYSILSMGVNLAFAPTGNNTLIGNREIL